MTESNSPAEAARFLAALEERLDGVTTSQVGSDHDGERSFLEMVRLLIRYADSDMDQFDHIRLPSHFGELFVSLTREPPADLPAEQFRRIDL